jgi:23S rRNA (cytosine1962-C5)-methyltransferase
MSKPKKARTDSTQKAAGTPKPQLPFGRPPKKASQAKPSPAGPSQARPAQTRPRSADPVANRGPKRPPAPATKPAAPAHSQAKGPARNSAAPTVGALINRRASDRLRNGHLWVYASDIESIEVPDTANPPALLPVADSRGLLLGTALYSPASQIALRLISREEVSQAAWLELLATRLRKAIGRRGWLLKDEQNNACRICFSEADELPGLVIDKYSDLVILQLLAKGLDSPEVRAACVKVLQEELNPAAILERPDPRVRELEGLGAPSLEPLFVADDTENAASTQFRLNGLVFHYDANSGQKTGAFLDQRANYKVAADWAWLLTPGGRALDVCTYQGGFALHLARVSKQVTGIDASRSSLEVAEKNLVANRDLLGAEVDWVAGDAFQILRDWSDAGEKFDTIVLDPPAFAKSLRAVEGALRGYKELNLRALKMLRPGGLLITCSCSHHVSLADLEATVASAALDADRRVQLLERRGAAPDHPVVLNLPETEYLKCLILQVE